MARPNILFTDNSNCFTPARSATIVQIASALKAETSKHRILMIFAVKVRGFLQPLPLVWSASCCKNRGLLIS